jgi:hypothetical protein
MKSYLLFFGFIFIFLTSFGQGPLTGIMVINKGEIEKKWKDLIEYEFILKNAGTKAIEILKVTGSCTCQATKYKTNLQVIQPGKTGVIKVTVTVDQNNLGNEVINGVIDYDKSIIVTTNGKKQKYQLYTRAKIKIKN